jgi:hypothetical protein
MPPKIALMRGAHSHSHDLARARVTACLNRLRSERIIR